MNDLRVLFLVFVLVLSTGAFGQTRGAISAGSSCGIALVHQTAVIGDEGQHSISLDQRKCTFEKPLEIAGVQIAEYISSGVDDVQFDRSRDQGYAVGEATNGDKYFLRYEGTATMKNGVPAHLEGSWKFAEGTGKLRGLTGQGRYSAQPTSSGGMVFRIEGRFEVSAEKHSS